MGKDRADDKISGSFCALRAALVVSDFPQKYSNYISTTVTAAKYCLAALTTMVTLGYLKMSQSRQS